MENYIAASPAYLNRTDQLYINSKNIKPLNGYEDIIVHGDEIGFAFQDSSGKESIVSVYKFAEILKQTPSYMGGAIRLISCGTASESAISAQELANIMGVDILAPSDTVWVDFEGNMTIGKEPKENTGEWVKLKPKGRHE
jgi:hypothetical protein